MNSDKAFSSFFLVNRPGFSNPLEFLKDLLSVKESELARQTDPSAKKKLETFVGNVGGFINFVEKPATGEIEYIERTNIGDESAGIEHVLINVLKFPEARFDDAQSRKVAEVLYGGKDNSDKVYFLQTKIPNVYEWREIGETEEISSGTLHHDSLRGFVKTLNS